MNPRWPAGSGRDSGEWSGGASIDTAGVKDFIARLLLEAARRAARALLRPSEPEPANPEVVKPETKPLETPETEQQPNVDANKLHHIFDNPDHPFGDFVSQYGSQGAAFQPSKMLRVTRCRNKTSQDNIELALNFEGVD